ncbi:TIGR02302 family protein [Methylobacterium sp. BTF04]|uniref:TIGR02302 family protein n=1 Tax=Methylobacterium sp. BTF04 TaxID=2708300 RepID=UPI0013D102A1|nr:TIGR02302 family protein [Methylobacterium sp. BTF04]NEU14005.1 TIGR02302 family protein [Methylobacterium sp. BTF04]
MGEADPATSGKTQSTSGEAALRRRLDRLVVGSQAAGLWEQAWPILWRGLAVGLAFLVVSWLGLWLDLGPIWRMLGLAVFGLAFLAALAPLVLIRRPTRREALTRIDREAAGRQDGGALDHGPASAVEDTLAVGTGDPETQALWALHRRRSAAVVARLSPGAPRPAMSRRDPFALRAAILVGAVASLFVAGSEWRQRVGTAFDWQTPPLPGPSFRVDGWIDPPLYTRLPPLVVTMSGTEQRLRAPVNSTLIVRIAGHGEAVLTTKAGLKPLPGKPPHADLREDRFQLTGGVADLTIATGGAPVQHLVVETIPDTPPEVRRIGALEVNARGTFNLTYRAKDDYGIASAEGVVEPLGAGRSLVPPPRIGLALPGDPSGETDTKTLVDLTDNPWSGARVRLTLVVKDEAGQEGRTPTAEVVLPARIFSQPLARALAEERRRLITAPDESRGRVQTALDALLITPDRFTPQPSIFLGLKTASRRLRAARSDETVVEVADLLWEMALKIEDGDLSDAEKSLRAAQDNLKQAIERNAPDEEIKKLTEDLKQALDKFMKNMAERQNKQQKPPGEKSPPKQGGKTVTPDDLNKMLKDMADAMKRGDTAEAQRLLDQLREILENLQTAEQGGKSDPSAREMSKQADELDKLAREQQGLRDETFKDGQDKNGAQQGRPPQGQRPQRGQQGQSPNGQRGPPGQQGQGQQGQGQQGQGEQGQKGQGQKGQGGVGDRQQALRERLQDLQNRMKELGMQGEDGLSDAEEAMREAEGALGQGKEGDAVEAQGRALDGLKKGAEGMQKQMQDMAEGKGKGEGEGEGEQEGGQNPSQQGQAGNREDDPLGRPTKGRDMSNGNARVPTADESAVQRTRRIMEELRRKLGDPSRPREELDYFERLLRRN